MKNALAFDSMGLAHFVPSAKLEKLERPIIQTHVHLSKNSSTGASYWLCRNLHRQKTIPINELVQYPAAVFAWIVW